MNIRFVLCCFLLSLPVWSGAQERNAACRIDVEQFCSQSKGSGQQAMQCLLDHQKEVSDACYDTLKKRVETQRAIKACKPDAEKFCKGVEPGGGRIISCLVEHQKEISDDCYDQLAKRKAGGSS
ncbi:MAG: cysteine rich repeat-containing protein [Betaproteobacteria bacterium]